YRPAYHRCPALRTGARAAIGAAGAGEDRWQSFLRHPVPDGVGRGGAARVRPRLGGLGLARRAHSGKTLHRQHCGPHGWETKPAPSQHPESLATARLSGPDITTVILVHGEPEAAIHAALWDAVRAGLVLRMEDAYAFLHDRVQEAAYALIPEGDRA